MKFTSYDIKDVGKRLQLISEEDARELIEGGVPIILRTRPRYFFRVYKISDLEAEKRLKEMGIHEIFQFFID